MKLLIISNNLNRAGFRQRIAVYLDILKENGITCKVVKLPSGFYLRRKLFKRAKEFDGVLLHKKGLNPFDAFWLRKYSKKIIYDFDDAIMFSDKQPDKYSRSHFWPFRRTVRMADMVITGNQYLAAIARKFNRNVKTIPTGLDTSAYYRIAKGENNGKIRLVWIGSKSTLKYLAEIKPALEKIGLLFDNVILRIICDDFFDLRNMEVEKHQWSLEEQTIDLTTSDIGLAPLPDNRFTKGKCGFKILQYAVASLPVVASPVGVNADYVKDGVTGFLAASDSQWINGVSKLVKDPNLRKSMGLTMREQVKKFDVNVIGKQLCDVIEKCVCPSNP